MGSIADSDAVCSKERQLTQHQAVLTLVQQVLGNPLIKSFRWLDLACGKGQIIIHLDINFTQDHRAKIEYYGYDVQTEYLRLAEKTAKSFGLKFVKMATGELSNFHKIYNKDEKFDLITLTNTVHEIDPKTISLLLFESLYRLTPNGFLFIYDMEKLPRQELGAITWTKEEFEEIIKFFVKRIGSSCLPISSRWQHSSCTGWNTALYINHLDIHFEEIEMDREAILSDTNKVINKIIDRKYELCKVSLENLTLYGPEVREEEDQIKAKLYEFWALSRAKGACE